MRRDVAIAELMRGRLSEDERALVTPTAESVRESQESAPGERPLTRRQIETFLYEHLSIAARARMRMDASRSWSTEYHTDYRAREIALAQASRHYRALLSMGAIDPLLAQMAMTEGLTP